VLLLAFGYKALHYFEKFGCDGFFFLQLHRVRPNTRSVCGCCIISWFTSPSDNISVLHVSENGAKRLHKSFWGV